MTERDEKLRKALIVNLTSSRCGNCGRDADPNELRHKTVLGYRPQPGAGCGIRWQFVTSDYSGGRPEQGARELRPDLEWFDRWQH